MAYGLIRGRPVEKMEFKVNKPRTDAYWKKVKAMIERYGPLDSAKKAELLARCRE